MESVKELIAVYRGLQRSEPSFAETAGKVHRIVVTLLETLQLDIILHMLNDEVFLDMLDLFSDMHRDKAPAVDYRRYFAEQTRFVNFHSFPPKLVENIHMRYKLLFVKDYVLCDHPKEELLGFLNSVGRADRRSSRSPTAASSSR